MTSHAAFLFLAATLVVGCREDPGSEFHPQGSPTDYVAPTSSPDRCAQLMTAYQRALAHAARCSADSDCSLDYELAAGPHNSTNVPTAINPDLLTPEIGRDALTYHEECVRGCRLGTRAALEPMCDSGRCRLRRIATP